MSYFKHLTSETKTLTRALAEEFRDMKPSPTERELNQPRCGIILERTVQNLTVPFHWATAKLNGEIYRTNGRHSSTVLANTDWAKCVAEFEGTPCKLDEDNFPVDLKVHIDHFQVGSLSDLALLFWQFDDRGSARTLNDVAGAYQGTQKELSKIPRDIAKLGIDGIAWEHMNISGVPVPSGNRRYELFGYKQLRPFLLWLGGLLDAKTQELQKKAIVAAMFTTWQTHQDEAKVFWGEVANRGRPFDPTFPTTALDAWLVSLVDNKKLREELKPGNYYQCCIAMWNAYREEKAVQAITRTHWDHMKKGFFDAVE